MKLGSDTKEREMRRGERREERGERREERGGVLFAVCFDSFLGLNYFSLLV